MWSPVSLSGAGTNRRRRGSPAVHIVERLPSVIVCSATAEALLGRSVIRHRDTACDGQRIYGFLCLAVLLAACAGTVVPIDVATEGEATTVPSGPTLSSADADLSGDTLLPEPPDSDSSSFDQRLSLLPEAWPRSDANTLTRWLADGDLETRFVGEATRPPWIFVMRVLTAPEPVAAVRLVGASVEGATHLQVRVSVYGANTALSRGSFSTFMQSTTGVASACVAADEDILLVFDRAEVAHFVIVSLEAVDEGGCESAMAAAVAAQHAGAAGDEGEANESEMHDGRAGGGETTGRSGDLMVTFEPATRREPAAVAINEFVVYAEGQIEAVLRASTPVGVSAEEAGHEIPTELVLETIRRMNEGVGIGDIVDGVSPFSRHEEADVSQ